MESSPLKDHAADIVKDLGKRIRHLRTGGPKKLTQEDLAERADISVSFVSMIERGERAPHLETLSKIAEGLGVSLVELFTSPDEPPEQIDAALRPLAEFARRNSLTRQDIERLLGVAKALF